eukprot:scaffold1446_cov62-Cyclotella_meneghiniana.AAC.1
MGYTKVGGATAPLSSRGPAHPAQKTVSSPDSYFRSSAPSDRHHPPLPSPSLAQRHQSNCSAAALPAQ